MKVPPVSPEMKAWG